VIWDGPWKIFGQFRWAANFFVCSRLGHQTKTHVNYILHKDIKLLIIKVNKLKLSKLSNANDAIQEASTLFYTTTGS
jgi:hypothetical protein